MSRQRWRFLALLLVLLAGSAPSRGAWWLWESPHDNTELPDQSQPEITRYKVMQGNYGLGQSFVPQEGLLYRMDFMMKNRYDLRPFTIKLWEWEDLDQNGQTEDLEYAATVANGPVWEDRLSIPGSEDRVLVTVFPRVSVNVGKPYYVEFSNETMDGEWAIFCTEGDTDAYPEGRGRVSGIFRYLPVTPEYMDFYFQTYSGPDGAPAPLTCGDSGGPAPCVSTLEPWEPPDASGPPVTAADLFALIESKANGQRASILYGDGKYAHWHSMYDAFLYRVTADETYALHAMSLFHKAMAWRESDPEQHLDFTWLEYPGWAYEWIKDSPSLTAEDHETIRTLLLHTGMRIWPDRESGVNNHPLARALGYKLATRLIPDADFATLSACSPGPPPACDGLFQDGDQLTAADHAAWEAYALEVWNEFTTHWDILEDSGRYYYMDFQFLLEMMLLYDPEGLVWQDPGFRALVDRLFENFLPLGTYPAYGDTSGWNLAWATPFWLFESAADEWQEPKYKWAAYRAFDYRRTHLKDRLANGTPLEMWQAVYQEHPSICHAYFALASGVTAAQPADQTEQAEAGQDQVDSVAWTGAAAGLGQTFVATKSPLVRIDVRIDNGEDPSPVSVRLWEWQSDYGSTVSGTPLYAATVDVHDAAPAQERSLLPFLEVNPGTTYYVEFSRSGAFEVLGSPAGGMDEYAEGDIWVAGKERNSADLWFRTFSLTDSGSKVTERLEVFPRRISDRGMPPRFHDFGAQQIPDKLILRSGYDIDDLHAVVNLVSGEFFHGQLETGALLSLVHNGSALLVDTNYTDRREKDHSKLITRRYWGGTHEDPTDPLTVSHFVDYRATSVAWLDWGDPQGWGADHHRRFYFVKNRFLIVRDRTSFSEALTASTGSLWHAYDVHPEHGPNWYDLFDREPLGVNGWIFKNPEQYVLLYMVDRPGTDLREWEVTQSGNPISPPYIVTQRWVGDALAGDALWFDSVLLPHGSELTPGEAAANIEVAFDDGTNVVLKISVGDEIWSLVDNPEDITINTAGLTTDARYLVARTGSDGANYLLANRASTVDISDGPGRRISFNWPARSSTEILDTSTVQDLDSDFIVDALDDDDDDDGVADAADSDPVNGYVCGDVDGDSCDDCSSGVSNPADDGPDPDLDGLCDAGDNCPAVVNLDQADTDSDGFGDLCDNCATLPNGFQEDGDTDGVGDICDNCPDDVNADQNDADGDILGDACDNCPAGPNPGQADQDLDQHGDICDNCPEDQNADQANSDADPFGDACDNCLLVVNADQSDFDSDDEGDRCDIDDGWIYVDFHQMDRIDWQEEAGFVSWNCYRGDLNELRALGLYTQLAGSNGLAQRWCDWVQEWVDDGEIPGAGDSAFYLVTGIAANVESDLGEDSDGTVRPNHNPCP